MVVFVDFIPIDLFQKFLKHWIKYVEKLITKSNVFVLKNLDCRFIICFTKS